MKLKLFNKFADPVSAAFAVVAGGVDTDSGKLVFIVKGDEDVSGTLTLDPSEARKLNEAILVVAPTVTKV